MIEALIILAAGIGGYLLARRFVRRRLRFVDAAQSPLAPFVAGITCAALLLPLVFLPVVSGVTPLAFGLGAAFGTVSGARFHRRADSELRRLAP
jgi:CHASE2 domain-containing sensor protein